MPVIVKVRTARGAHLAPALFPQRHCTAPRRLASTQTSSGQSLSYDVSPTDTVQALKEKIQVRVGRWRAQHGVDCVSCLLFLCTYSAAAFLPAQASQQIDAALQTLFFNSKVVENA